MQRATKTQGKPATLKSVIARVPGWSRQLSLKTKALGGVTNKNYLVTARSGKFMICRRPRGVPR